jgi:dual specificity protein kinase YAK1
MTVFEDISFSIRAIYHEINPSLFPPPDNLLGRALNAPEEDPEGAVEEETDDGYRVFSVNEILSDPDNHHYRVIDLLGNGTFSYAVKCEDLARPSEFLAIKVLKNIPIYHAAGLQEVRLHDLLARAPDHPGKRYCVMPVGHFEINQHICIVEPLMSRSLFEGLPQCQYALDSLRQIRSIIAQLLQTLAFLHVNGVIHCDIKPDNVLFLSEDSDEIRLIDFGSATTVLGSHQAYIQSRFYRSIEVMIGLPVGCQIDLWSVGCMAAELFMDFAIFACESETDSVPCIVGMLGEIPDSILAVASNWRKFFDMTPSGYQLKADPTDALLNKHLYASVFRDSGVLTLSELIMSRYPLATEEETMTVTAFSHFVHALLAYDPMRRLTADSALGHPFITGEPFSESWQAPAAKKKPQMPAPAKKPLSDGIVPVDLSKAADFLSLM